MQSGLVYDFVTLLAVINPIEAAATFASLTGGRSVSEQNRIALRASATALVILVGFGFVGEGLLRALGIGFPAFRIAGGLLLFCVGFKMVFAQETGTQELSADEQAHAVSSDDPSVFPLAIPIITGPGALTTIVALMSKRRETPAEYAFVVAISVVILVLTYWTMRESHWLSKVFGPSGINAVGRIMGIIVAAIAIQLIIDGVQEVFPVLSRAVASVHPPQLMAAVARPDGDERVDVARLRVRLRARRDTGEPKNERFEVARRTGRAACEPCERERRVGEVIGGGERGVYCATAH